MAKVKKHKIRKHMTHNVEKTSWWTKQKVWTVILAGLMIFSVFGIILSGGGETREKLDYGNYSFKQIVVNKEYQWTTEIDDNTYTFDYHPSDVEGLDLPQDVIDALTGIKSAYITFDPNIKNLKMLEQLELVKYKMQQTLFKEYSIYLSPGILTENDNYVQPIVTCENATAYVPVFKFVESDNTSVYLDRNYTQGACIVVESTERSALAVKDRILYSLAGII